MKNRLLYPASALLLVVGLPLAVPSRPVPAAVAAPEAGKYQLDPVHCTACFRVKHLGCSWFNGRFNKITGSILLDEKDLSGSSVQIEIDPASVDTNSAQRDAHLRSQSFFNAKEFPKITFQSTKVKKAGKDGFEITGDLELHGVTKPITLKVDHVGTSDNPRMGHREGFETGFKIKRSDYGMDFMVGMVGDEITLRIGIEAVRE
ncbi:MAG: YceI family protein [Planctomycetota bacterium]